MRHPALAVFLFFLLAISARSQDAPASPLHKQLMGHWVADKDSHLHTYFSFRGRMVENNHPDSDAAFSMMDYQLWDEWPEARTIILAADEGGRLPVMLVITFSEDGKSANVREKTSTGWAKAYKLRRVDDKTHPTTLPLKLKVLDMENGLGTP